MDTPDNQVKENNFSFDVKSDSDFLTEIFEGSSQENELKQAKCFLSVGYQEIVTDLMNGDLNSSCDNPEPCNIEEKKNPLKETSFFAKLSKENKKLKQANKQLRKKNIIQERSIANYEVKLARCMTDLLSARKELAETKKAKESCEMGNANLQCHVNQIEAELKQYRGLKLRNNEENQKIQELEKAISLKLESIRRLKKNSITNRLDVAKKDTLLKKLQNYNRQILSLLTEFGCKLIEAGLITKNYMMGVLQKCQEEYLSPKASVEVMTYLK